MKKRDSMKAWTSLLRAGRCLAMRRASVMRRRFQGWTERNGFQEKMLCGCTARWCAGSVCVDVSSVRAFRFLLVSPI